MRKWIIRAVLLLFACAIGAVAWFFFVFMWPSIKYDRVHRAIYRTTSLARLQRMAHDAAVVADSLDARSSLGFSRPKGNIPSWAGDLDPGWVDVQRDQITVELCGGFDHYGFVFSRSESDSNLWTISRRDESHSEEVGTYRHSGAAINSVEPTRALSGASGSP